MKEPIWLRKDVLLAVHERLLAEHGGGSGIRDESLLDSALGRPRNLFAYKKASLFALATSYASGIIRNHPFIDGNKRVGFMAAFLFLGRNGQDFRGTESDVVLKTLALAAVEMGENEYTQWLRENCQARREK